MAVEKKATGKTAEVKAPAAKAEAPKAAAPAAKAEAPKAAAPVAKAEAPKAAAPAAKAAAPAAPAAKKETVKKETEKKTAAPKKEAVKKEAPAAKVVIEFAGKSVVAKDVLEAATKAYGKSHKGVEIKSIDIYVKPEESVAYYVVNGEGSDDFKVEL